MTLSIPRTPRTRFAITFGALFALMLLRCCAFGFSYYPQLDDYIQYHNYLNWESFSLLCETVGLLASRPLAGIADYFFWGRFFSCMIIGVAIICAMYTFCTLQLQTLLRRYVPVGPLFPVVMCLFPLGMEGLYWMSASTRIVSGLFFGCLAAMAFAQWLDTGRWYWALLYLPLQILPFGFYEQSAVLSMTIVLGMALLEVLRRPRRAILALWALAAMVLYFGLLKQFSGSGVYASRTEFVLPTSSYYWETFLPEVLGQLKAAYISGGLLTCCKGLLRGLKLVFAPALLLWLAAVLVCVGLYIRVEASSPAQSASKWNRLLALLMGFLLFLAPITPFFLLANPWFSLRGTVTSFAGLALIIDTVGLTLFDRSKTGRKVYAGLSGLAAVLCVIACVSEIKDYRDTYLHDQHVASVLLEELEGLPRSTRVGVLNLPATALEDQNFHYHEHIVGCTESDWALSGLLTCQGGEEHPSVIPLPTPILYKAWNCQSRRAEQFDLMYYYEDGTLRPVTLDQIGEHEFMVYDQSGLLGHIWEDEKQIGYFELLTP